MLMLFLKFIIFYLSGSGVYAYLYDKIHKTFIFVTRGRCVWTNNQLPIDSGSQVYVLVIIVDNDWHCAVC